MDPFSNVSDRLTWGDSDVMFAGMQHSPESSTAQDVDFSARADRVDLNSMYETPLHRYGEPSDRLLTNRLNTSSLYTGYDTERGEVRVSGRSVSVNAKALRPRFNARQPIYREQFLRDSRSPVHRMTQEDLFGRVSPRAGCSSNPSEFCNPSENLPELSGGFPYHPAYEAAGAYTLHFGSSFNGMDGMLSTDRSRAETEIQTHALFPYIAAAHIDCCKVGAEPADVKRLDEAAMNYHLQPKNNNFRLSPESQLELDTVMEELLKMVVGVKQEMEELSNTEKAWCDEMHAKLLRLGPSSSPMELPTGYGAERNMRAWANEGSTSVMGDKMLQGPYWENRSGFISEEAKQARALKDWLKSKHTVSEISRLRGQCMKKRRQGKHSQTSRDVLVEWFERHCEWPYPSDEEKLHLARLTGLETRQINNWFINQRKRHWESHVKNQANLQIEHELRTSRQVAQREEDSVDRHVLCPFGRI